MNALSSSEHAASLGGSQPERPSSLSVFGYALGFLALAVGFLLRLSYAEHASPYIDEFTTLWAAQRVVETGLPQFPTGAVYTQGLIYTYLEALAQVTGGASNILWARLPSLVLGVASLALTLYAARRLFQTTPVGLAALWLALDGEAIVWGGRVRTYALLQPVLLAAFLAWYYGAVVDDRPRLRWLAILFLLVALVDQPVTLLILPPLALLALAARGGSWLRQPVVWLQAGVVALALLARWGLYQMMVPAGAVVAGETRSFVDLFRPFADWQIVASFFTEPSRLIPTLFLVGGVFGLMMRPRSMAVSWKKPVAALAWTLGVVALEMLVVVEASWRHPRYMYPLLPLLFLGGEGVAVPALRNLASRVPRAPFRRLLAALTAVVALGSVWMAYPGASSAANRDEWGYDRAMRFVGDGWSEGDALATIAPAAALVILDRCDYLAVEEGGVALAIEREGQTLDGWTGLPVIDSAEALAQALDAHSRLWFVVDEMRLNRHFGPEFSALLWERFDLVAFERGTLVFRSRPAEEPAAIDRAIDIDFAGQLRLVGYALSDDRPGPGDTVTVLLRWQPMAPRGEVVAFVHMIDRLGQGLAGHDAPPLGGLYPVGRWPQLARTPSFPDRHALTLPDGLPPGQYLLQVGLYRPGTLEPVGERVTLDFLWVGGQAMDVPVGSEVARFGEAATLHLLGLEGSFVPGGLIQLQLAWQVGLGFDKDYTLMLHLLDERGEIAQQWDGPPIGGWVPTSFWKPGEILADQIALDLSPMLAPGHYRLVTGLYRQDGARLPLDDGSDSVELAAFEWKP